MNPQQEIEKNIDKLFNPFDNWQDKFKTLKKNISKNNISKNNTPRIQPSENQIIETINKFQKNNFPFQKEEKKNVTEVDSFNENLQNCFNCPLGIKDKQKIPCQKNDDAKIMMLCEMPHYEDQEINQKYFSHHKISETIDNIIYSLKFSKESIYFSSILKCHSTVEKRNEIYNHLDQYRYCQNHLKKELDLMPNISLIIVFGEIGYWLLTDKNQFDEDRGELLDYHQRKIFFTDTIQNALLSSQKKVDFWQDFKKNNLFQDFEF